MRRIPYPKTAALGVVVLVASLLCVFYYNMYTTQVSRCEKIGAVLLDGAAFRACAKPDGSLWQVPPKEAD